MKKYFFNDGTSQQGPFTIEELKEKNINSETPVRSDDMPDWTTAGQLEELKVLLANTPPPQTIVSSTSETPVTPVAATAQSGIETPPPAATVQAVKPASKSPKKKTAWVSYVLALLVFGGVGFLVYQDMEKNKGTENSQSNLPAVTDSTANMEMHQMVVDANNETQQSEDMETEEKTEDASMTTAPAETVTTVTSESKTNTPPVATKVKTEKTKPVLATAKPGTNTLKAQQEAAQKQAELIAAKEKDYRNNWTQYITAGKLDYVTKGDGVEAFNVPVYNGTNKILDKVTVRVDYMKKEKKVQSSETIVIYNIPPGSGLNGKAPANKKGNNIKVFITGITSRSLHFCYPSGSGIPGDPYYCN